MHSPYGVLTLALQLSLHLQASAAALILPFRGLNNTSPSQPQALNADQSLALSETHKPRAVNIPIPLDAGLSLTTTYLGSPIDPDDLDIYLYYGLEIVRRFFPSHTNEPIQHGRWSFGELPELQVLVAANPEATITYAQLFSVLGGLQQFMLGGEKKISRNLAFDVNLKGTGKIGFGLIWNESPDFYGMVGVRNTTSFHVPPPANSSSLNTLSSNSSLQLATTEEKQWISIPTTGLTLVFDFFGATIPQAAFDDAFAAANLEIIDYIGRYMDWPLPNNRFEYDDTDAHIVVIADRGIPITWLQLFQILQGLYGFVSGPPSRSQLLHYQIYREKDLVGFGLLWYNDIPKPRVGVATS